MKIAFYCLRDFDELPLCEEMKEKYGIDFVWTAEAPNKDNLSLAEGCLTVSITPCLMTEEYVDILHGMGVRYIVCRSIGYDHLPLSYLKSLGMRSANTTYPTGCVADFAIMLILMTTRMVKETTDRLAIQDFSLKGKMGREIGDLTIGVLGTGHIGQVLISHLKGFGCRILCYDAYPSDKVAEMAEYADLETIYREADVLTLHMPSNEDTYHMLNKEAFSKMKRGMTIVNTARGGLIDTSALVEALRSGQVAAAGLDVIEQENGLVYYDLKGQALRNDELALLKSFPNVILTGHTAFYTETTVRNMVEKSFTSTIYFENGQDNPNEV